VIVYLMTSPASLTVALSAVLLTSILGCFSLGTSTSSSSSGSSGFSPPALTTFNTPPLSMSACVTAYSSSELCVASGARVALLPLHSRNSTAVTVSFSRVTWPVLVTVIMYLMTSPASLTVALSAVLLTSILGCFSLGTSTSSSSSGSSGFSPPALTTF